MVCVYLYCTHNTYFSIFFLLHCSNFIKMCEMRYAQIMTFFFLLVDINLNHNVILYFFYYIVNFVLVVNVFLALY
jgi:hypothetical protein